MNRNVLIGVLIIFLTSCASNQNEKVSQRRIIKAWMIGDSTMADYSKYRKLAEYKDSDNPITGWGQVFQPFMSGNYLAEIKDFLHADSVIVDDRAVGGRTTRSFFEEGKWRTVYDSIKPGDIVIIQFGHNDAGIKLPEILDKRGYPEFVDLGYKEYLRFYVRETREKGATPILLTPVARNYPWENDTLRNVHGKFPQSVMDVVDELDVLFIDLNQLSMDLFTSKGKDYVSENYFMNLPAGKYKSVPDGLKDNTHFQPEGATEVARLVYNGLKEIATQETELQ